MKNIIKQIISDWKQLGSDVEKTEFLEKVKEGLGAKNNNEILESMKDVHGEIKELHAEVFESKIKPIQVSLKM